MDEPTSRNYGFWRCFCNSALNSRWKYSLSLLRDCRSDSISCGVKGPGAQEGADFGFGEGAGVAAVEIVGLEEFMELRYAITGLRSRCDVPIPTV